MRARRESLGTVGTDGQWAIARGFMMLCFAAAGLLVLTYQPSRSRSPHAAHRLSAPQPSATVSPVPPVSPSGDLPSRPGGWQPRAIAPIVPVAPQSATPPAPQTGSTPSPQPAPAAVPSPAPPSPSSSPVPSALSATSPPALVQTGSASRSLSSAQVQAVSVSSRNSDRSAPERALAALATGILPPTPSQADPRVQPRTAGSPRPQASGFVPVQSARKTLTTLPLHTPRLVVDLSDRQVYFYHGDQIKASYPVAIGQDGWETPQGTFRVIDRQTYPLWEHPITKELIGNDPRNPLGTRWISFWTDGVHSIGFHGTNRDDSVGQAVSHGCLRMRNADIEALYDEVALGTPVTVRE